MFTWLKNLLRPETPKVIDYKEPSIGNLDSYSEESTLKQFQEMAEKRIGATKNDISELKDKLKAKNFKYTHYNEGYYRRVVDTDLFPTYYIYLLHLNTIHEADYSISPEHHQYSPAMQDHKTAEEQINDFDSGMDNDYCSNDYTSDSHSTSVDSSSYDAGSSSYDAGSYSSSSCDSGGF